MQPAAVLEDLRVDLVDSNACPHMDLYLKNRDLVRSVNLSLRMSFEPSYKIWTSPRSTRTSQRPKDSA